MPVKRKKPARAGRPRAGRAADLARALGHRFSDPSLLAEALTHASTESDHPHNERLEFLGDRVLGVLAAEALLTAHPGAPEGDLAPRLNALVRKETCAEVAQEMGLPDALVLAPGEERSGGRRKTAILGDACEAVMAAVFLDGGLGSARAVFDRFWAERLKTLEAVPRDPKSQLQEWALAQGYDLPAYEIIGREGPDHAPEFEIEARIAGAGAATGSGPSRRVAEKAAATALYEKLAAPVDRA